jgi:hypothetical protein
MKLVWAHGWLDLPDPSNIIYLSMYLDGGDVKIDAIFNIKMIDSDNDFNVISSKDELIAIDAKKVYRTGLFLVNDGAYEAFDRVISEITDDIYNDTCDEIDLTNRFEEARSSVKEQ